MTEQQIQAIEIDAETDTELTVDEIVSELTDTVFGDDDTITPYKIHTVVNGTFEALENEKRIRPQMMYNYDRNGMIAKGRKGVKAYTKDEVKAFATKYVTKHTS